MNVNQDMVSNIEEHINSPFFIEMLKRNYDRYHNIHYISKLIGELYIHHIIHKDGFGYTTYMKKVEELYTSYFDKQISPEQFAIQRAKNIAVIIAEKLHINVSNPITKEDEKKIKDYFLQEYVANGYVSHAFPEAYYESIMANGLIASAEGRTGKPRDIMEIQGIFMRNGVMAPMGGYPYYGGHGIYYEHDFTCAFQHAIDAPEWFSWFTSADHTAAFHKNVEKTPYILRSKENCQRNVEDLCLNAGLSVEDMVKVLTFFNQQYDKFSSSKLNIALIPKRVVGKDDISKVGVQNMDLLNTINFVLGDGAKQYLDHEGNVYKETIKPKDFCITVVPAASMYMQAGEYLRETEEHLLSVDSNLAIIERAEGYRESLDPSMVHMVEEARRVLLAKKEEAIQSNMDI